MTKKELSNEEQVALDIFIRLLTDTGVYVDETYSAGKISSLCVDGSINYASVEEQEIFTNWLGKIRGEHNGTVK